MVLDEHPLPLLQWGAVLGASLVAALTDARSRRIPNVLTGPLYLLGLGVSLACAGAPGLLDAFLASLMLSFPFILLFAFAGGGAGDAKLMGALGAWLGVERGASVLVAVCFAGVVMALVHAWRHGRLPRVLVSIGGLARSVFLPIYSSASVKDAVRMLPGPTEGLKMPYGIAIFSGVVLAALGNLTWHI